MLDILDKAEPPEHADLTANRRNEARVSVALVLPPVVDVLSRQGIVINELATAENCVVVSTGSTGRQFSLEDPAWGYGASTKAMDVSLNGGAANPGNPRITHKMLVYFISDRVKHLTGRQADAGGMPDFPVA